MSRVARWRRADDTGSIPLAMLIVICGVGLSLALASSVGTQLTATRIDIGRSDALNAAQAGLDAVIAHIRAATDSDGAGRVGRLPCDQKTGAVGGAAPAGATAGRQATYLVTIRYYQFDPSRSADNPVLTCYPGSGTPKVPGFAVLTSTGDDGRPDGQRRTVTATYVLRNTNENIPGGLIRVWRMPGAPEDLCLDAGAVMPTATNDIELRVQKCDHRNPRQIFAYHSNLTLVYVPSRTEARPLGMCLDAGAFPEKGDPVQFEPCAATTLPRQQWSFTDNRNFVGTTATGDFNDLCFNLEDGAVQANTRIVLGSAATGGCYVGPDNNTQMFAGEASVGAGAAENSPNQLVNFAQFGRCLDVTQYDVTADFLISYPCKQAPDPTKVTWNQRFVFPPVSTSGEVTSGTGRIYTELVTGDYEKSGTGVPGRWCLSTVAVTATSPYVTLTRCPTETDTPQYLQWRVVHKSYNYTTGYRIEATVAGKQVCMAVGTAAVHMAPDEMSKIVVEPCSDATQQKWNAPAFVRDPSPLRDLREK